MNADTLPAVTVEPEAATYAERTGLRVALEHMLAVTPRLVPDLRSVRVTLKPDVDETGVGNVVWDVRIGPTTREAYVAAGRAWSAEFLRVAPRPRVGPFVLRLRDDEG